MAEIGFRIKHQAAGFGKGFGFEPAGSEMLQILTDFHKAGFEMIPGSFQEIDLQTGQSLTRLKLFSPKTGLEVMFGGTRVDVVLNSIEPSGKNVGEFSAFVDLATRCFETMSPFSKRKFHRMAAISQFMLASMDAATLQAAFMQTFNVSGLHEANPPYEWNARMVSRVSSAAIGEPVNAISNLARLQGEFRFGAQSGQFDGLSMEIDINTLAADDVERFELSHVRSFLTESTDLISTLADQRLIGI